jgi:putative endopeptidase
MKKRMLLFGFLIGSVLFFSCHQPVTETKTDILVDDIDTSVSPGQDFFLYANGGWIKKTPIPEVESYWGVGNLVQEDLYIRLKKINLDAVNTKAAEGTITQKIGDFWTSGMDTVEIEKEGLSPLKSAMDMINAIKTKEDFVNATVFLCSSGTKVLSDNQVSQDSKNSDVMAYYLWQGGIGMPDRDYYFNTDQKTTDVRNGYMKAMILTFKELGADSVSATAKANVVYQLETRLAKASRKLADLRDPYANYHKMDFATLDKLSPGFNWQSFILKMGISKPDSVIVGQPEFFTALSKEVSTTTLENWKDYFRFHLVKDNAGYLDSTTRKNFDDYRKALTGTVKTRDRWKRVLDAEQQAIGEGLGQLFAQEFFNEKAKQRYSNLIEAVRDAYKERIKKLTWMSDTTKQIAINKLTGMTKKVGYPDKWKDFSTMKIDRGPYVLNMQRANQWWNNYYNSKIGKPVDRSEWDITPQTYNAYYNPSNNEIVMPAAAFIIPGMQDDELDDAFVYGYAAANWIGHEMTHGFDDQGRQFDEKGNLRNWWLPQDSAQFAQRAGKIIRQFNEFNPVDTLHVNGSATQGENIADLGGMLIGLDAFRKTDTYAKGEKIGGYTPLQRFFLGYAYGWKFEMRKEVLAVAVMTDVHAPPKERVNGPVVNVPEFYEAFNIKPGDKMYRADSLRVNIW